MIIYLLQTTPTLFIVKESRKALLPGNQTLEPILYFQALPIPPPENLSCCVCRHRKACSWKPRSDRAQWSLSRPRSCCPPHPAIPPVPAQCKARSSTSELKHLPSLSYLLCMNLLTQQLCPLPNSRVATQSTSTHI